MNKRILKKEVAALAGVSRWTMKRNAKDYGWLKDCRCPGTGRATYNREKVCDHLKKRGMM